MNVWCEGGVFIQVLYLRTLPQNI